MVGNGDRRASWLYSLSLTPSDCSDQMEVLLRKDNYVMFLTAFLYNLTLRLSGFIHLLESNQASYCITPVPLGGFLGRDEWQLYVLTTNQNI